MSEKNNQNSHQVFATEEQRSIETLYRTRISSKRNPKSGEELKKSAISKLKALSERDM